MNIGDFFKEFILKTWYILSIVIGIILFILAVTIEPKFLTNHQLGYLAGVFFFIGFAVLEGTRKEVVGWLPPNAYRGGQGYELSQSIWRPDIINIVFLGLALWCFIALLQSPSAQPSTSQPTQVSVTATATVTISPSASPSPSSAPSVTVSP